MHVVSGLCSRRYLEMLLEYLQEYTDRVKPLLDQNELYGKILAEFEKKWESGMFPGWPVGLCLRDDINEFCRYYHHVFESFAFSTDCILPNMSMYYHSLRLMFISGS